MRTWILRAAEFCWRNHNRRFRSNLVCSRSFCLSLSFELRPPKSTRFRVDGSPEKYMFHWVDSPNSQRKKKSLSLSRSLSFSFKLVEEKGYPRIEVREVCEVNDWLGGMEKKEKEKRRERGFPSTCASFFFYLCCFLVVTLVDFWLWFWFWCLLATKHKVGVRMQPGAACRRGFFCLSIHFIYMEIPFF